MTHRSAAALVAVLLVAAPALQAQTGYHPDAQIAHVRAQLADGERQEAFALLVQYDDAWADREPDPREYFVFDRTDGENEDVLRDDGRAAYAAALRYRLTDDQSAAARAAAFVRAWAGTNRGIKPGQPSRATMKSAQLVTTFVLAADLLDGYGGWTAADQDQFDDWLRLYLPDWADFNGQTNNFVDRQLLGLLFATRHLGDRAAFDGWVDVFRSRLRGRFLDGGFVRHEVTRGEKSMLYSLSVLQHIVMSARLVYLETGEDLFFSPANGLKASLDTMLYYAERPDEWPSKYGGTPQQNAGSFLETDGAPEALPTFELAQSVYQDPAWERVLAPRRPIYSSSGSYPMWPTLMDGAAVLPLSGGPLGVAGASANRAQNPNEAANAVDGDLATRWSAEGDGAALTLDLGAARTVTAVGLAFYRGRERRARFDVELSSDGQNFDRAASGLVSGGRTDGVEVFTVPAREARYVRVVGRGNTENAWNSVTEARAYGDAGSAVPVPGQTVWLRSRATGRYVAADLNRDGDLVADRSAVGRWEQFDVVGNGDGTVSLRARANGRLVATFNDRPRLRAEGKNVGPEDTYRFVTLGGGAVALEAAGRGVFVTVNDGGQLVATEARADGPRERFDWGVVAAPAALAPAVAVASGLALEAYPNPARGAVTVAYTLDAPGRVGLSVYDALGRQVAVLAEGPHQGGVHRAAFEAGPLPAGVYVVRLVAAGRVLTQRLTVAR